MGTPVSPCGARCRELCSALELTRRRVPRGESLCLQRSSRRNPAGNERSRALGDRGSGGLAAAPAWRRSRARVEASSPPELPTEVKSGLELTQKSP